MTDRTTALKALLDMVEYGSFPAYATACDLGFADMVNDTGFPLIKTMYSAFSGSTFAALSLLAAVLPEWTLSLLRDCGPDGWKCHLLGPKPCGSARHMSTASAADTPARALLIATLKALIAIAEE